ncbi:MAG TPA: hypothetical protein VHL78_11535, partial [Actinomycetota bacterium]|nr:hypothetical protein [Actinomycetota bacterium]
APPPTEDEPAPPPAPPGPHEPGPDEPYEVEPPPDEPYEEQAEAYEPYEHEPAEVQEVYEDDEVELAWDPGEAERPWPEAAELWSCQIDWKPGYRKSTFRAMAAAPGARKRRPIAESAPIRWTLMGDADPDVPEVVAALRDLIAAVEAAGWERTDPGNDWFQQRFLWRREGEPGRVG